MATILPIYLVVDTSASTYSFIEKLSEKLTSVVHELATDQVVADTILVSVMTFSNEARVVVPLTRPDSVGILKWQADGGTQFSPVLRLLREVMAIDIAHLKEAGQRVYRPAVYFLTDGEPLDMHWTDALEQLQAERFAPTIIALGFGASDPATLRRLGSPRGRAFTVTEPSLDELVEQVARGIGRTLTSTVTSTVDASAGLRIGLTQDIPAGWVDVGETLI